MKAPMYARNLLTSCLGWLAVAKHDMGGELNGVANMTRSMAVSEELPTVVCLCGSTRFYEQFQKANFEETMAGKIVLSVGFYPHGGAESNQLHGGDVGVTAEQKVALDVLHKRKIDLAEEIYVINVNGYVGESTASEIAYALANGKDIRWLEPKHGEHFLRALGRKPQDDMTSQQWDEITRGRTEPVRDGDAMYRLDRKSKSSPADKPMTDDAAARKAALKVGAFVAVQPELGEFYVGHVRSLFQLSDGKDKVILEDDKHLVVCDEELVIAVAKDGREHEDALRSFYCSGGSSIDALLSVILDSLNKAKAG